jgi:hypothetical protein
VSARLTLRIGELYGWTMYPGYGGGPYRSPIRVEAIEALGGRQFELSLLNIFYAAGVQRMQYRLRTLRREATYIVAEQVADRKPTDRVVILEALNPRWCTDHMPHLASEMNTLFHQDGRPEERAFLRLLASY